MPVSKAMVGGLNDDSAHEIFMRGEGQEWQGKGLSLRYSMGYCWEGVEMQGRV